MPAEAPTKTQTVKSIAKALGLAVVGWIVLLIALSKSIGAITGFMLATVLAVGGFIAWLLVKHPKLGQFAALIVLDPDADFDGERAERQEQDRQGRAYLDRARRGDRHDST